jgi:hypothetical protein
LLIAAHQWGDEANNHYRADAKSVIAGMEEKFITKGSGQLFPRLNIGDPTHRGSVAPERRQLLQRQHHAAVDAGVSGNWWIPSGGLGTCPP